VHQRYGSQADATAEGLSRRLDEEAVSSFYSAYRDQAFGWENAHMGKDGHEDRSSTGIYVLFQPAPAGATERKGCGHFMLRRLRTCLELLYGRFHGKIRTKN